MRFSTNRFFFWLFVKFSYFHNLSTLSLYTWSGRSYLVMRIFIVFSCFGVTTYSLCCRPRWYMPRRVLLKALV